MQCSSATELVTTCTTCTFIINFCCWKEWWHVSALQLNESSDEVGQRTLECLRQLKANVLENPLKLRLVNENNWRFRVNVRLLRNYCETCDIVLRCLRITRVNLSIKMYSCVDCMSKKVRVNTNLEFRSEKHLSYSFTDIRILSLCLQLKVPGFEDNCNLTHVWHNSHLGRQ